VHQAHCSNVKAFGKAGRTTHLQVGANSNHILGHSFLPEQEAHTKRVSLSMSGADKTSGRTSDYQIVKGMVWKSTCPKAEIIQAFNVRAFSMVSAVVKVLDTTTTASHHFKAQTVPSNVSILAPA
jgi:hypothetical protein